MDLNFVLAILKRFFPLYVCVDIILPYLKYVPISKYLMSGILNPLLNAPFCHKVRLLNNQCYLKNEITQLKDQIEILARAQSKKDINVLIDYLKVGECVSINIHIRVHVPGPDNMRDYKIFNAHAGKYNGRVFEKDKYFEDTLQTMVTHAFKYIVT